jgi:dTDP-4-dehydrorhamnose reductase
MRCVVLGAGGQLGGDLVGRLPCEVVPLTRAGADLTQPGPLRAALHELRPDVVVNCAAYNFVDRAEAETDAAFAVNAWGARHLAEICRDLGCLLAHFSTDYVFGLDEGRSTPYLEDDAPGPVSVYGLSKLAGEYLVRALCPRHLVLRTCGLYGRRGSGGKGGNFVETMLRLASQGKPLRVVADQVCTPSYTVDVAAAAAELIQAGRCGLYHVTNSGACSWHELAEAIFKVAGVPAQLTAITSAEYGAAARRPGYSVLGTRHDVKALRSWREALADYLRARNDKPAAIGCRDRG